MSAQQLSLIIGGVTTMAFLAMVAFVIRVTPEGSRARVLTALATLMASLPAVLFALYGR